MRRISTQAQQAFDIRYAQEPSGDTDKWPTSNLHPSGRKGMGDLPLDKGAIDDMQNLDSSDGGKSTASTHLQQDPTNGGYHFTPERQALHDSIIKKFLSQDESGNPVQRSPEAHPTYSVLGGGPATGKTNLVNSGALNGLSGANPVMINADEMKNELPEYKDGVANKDPHAALFAHEESSYLAKRLQAAAIENHYNMTLDGTGDNTPQSMMKKIGAARNAGYQVNGVYATVPSDMAVDRAMTRAAKTGRNVPEHVIRSTHKSVSQVLPQISDQFDNMKLFDTSTRDIKPVASQKKGGKLQIHDPQGWSDFVNKGNEDENRVTHPGGK